MKKIALILLISALFGSCKSNDPELNVTAKATYLSCATCQDGKIDLTIVGGKAPYTISWSNGAVTEDLENLAKGSYLYTVTDSKKTTRQGTVVIDYEYELIKIETKFGDMIMWLYDETPLHKANFLKLTKEKFYDNLIFHRVIKDFVIQGGDPLGNGTGGPGYTIDAEFVSTIKHIHGAVGAARDNNPQKKSNGSQFYIVENANGTPSLNNNYTVFGLVIQGLDVVSTIASVPKSASDKPLDPVYMKTVSIIKVTKEQVKSQYGFDIP